MISIVITMMKLVTTINRLLIWVSLRMCESDERALPTDKSTPDSLEGQKLHRILRHRHTDTQTQTRVLEIPQQVRVSTASTDTDKTQDTDTNADTDKSTPDSSEGQRLHRILRHRKDYLRFHRRSDSPQIPQTQIHGNKRRHRQEYSRFLRESPTKIETDIFALPGTR